ncbi:hypothetical protein BC830DRAFT_1089516 [Chytriomyces sp. MP71]|nr:hypothetical protein BC830DRAFT_1089516 [Chytriomyces sp. MP71]
MNRLVSRPYLGKIDCAPSDTFRLVGVRVVNLSNPVACARPRAIIIPSIVNSLDDKTTPLNTMLLDMSSFPTSLPLRTFFGAGAIDLLNPEVDDGPATTPERTPSTTQDSPTSEIDHTIMDTDMGSISHPARTIRIPQTITCLSRGCDKKFTTLSHMHSHLRSHDALREFACEQCTKSFARRHDLNRVCSMLACYSF